MLALRPVVDVVTQEVSELPKKDTECLGEKYYKVLLVAR